MARTFNGTTDLIRFSIGGLSSVGAANTFVAIVQRGSDTTTDTMIGLHNSLGDRKQAMLIRGFDTLELVNETTGGSDSTFTVLSADGWVLLAVGKGTGTVVPRMHKYVFSTNTWTHENGDTPIADGFNAGASGFVESSNGGVDLWHGEIAALGVFGQNLSDAKIESLPFSFATWLAYAPLGMWVFDQSAVSQAILDQTGRGANETTRSGTSVSSVSVPVLSYGAAIPTLGTATPPDPNPTSTEAYTLMEQSSVFTPSLVWGVLIDWDGDSLTADTYTGATVTGSGTSSTPDYLVGTDADAVDIAVGDTVQLFNSLGLLKESTYFKVYFKNSAFGFTNSFFAPNAAAVTVSGDQLRAVVTGGFDGPYDDVTARVLTDSDLVAEFGRDQARSLSPTASGRASLSLDNRSLDYSPDNVYGPLYGKILPARPLQVKATLAGVEYILFRGFYDDFELKPNKFTSSIDVTGLDTIAKFRDAKITTALYQGIRTGDAVNLVLDAIGWPAEKRQIDAGATTIRWWWEEGTDAFSALEKIVNSEGPPALLHSDERGHVVFRDRHHRLLSTASTAVQATVDSIVEPAFSELVYDHGWRDVVNSVVIAVTERDPPDFPEEVYNDASGRSIEEDTTLQIDVALTDPVIDPVLTFTFNSGGSALYSIMQTSGQKLTLNIQAVGADAFITDLLVMARPVAERNVVTVTVEDLPSQDKYGKRDMPDIGSNAPWAGVHDALAIGQLIIGKYAERTPLVTATFRSSTAASSTRLIQQLSSNLSDRIHVRNTEAAVDHDFFLDQIKHRVMPADNKLETQFGMERATSHASNIFIFDKTGHGFNDGFFAQVGLDDPLDLFIFDTSGHGFNDGVFAT